VAEAVAQAQRLVDEAELLQLQEAWLPVWTLTRPVFRHFLVAVRPQDKRLLQGARPVVVAAVPLLVVRQLVVADAVAALLVERPAVVVVVAAVALLVERLRLVVELRVGQLPLPHVCLVAQVEAEDVAVAVALSLSNSLVCPCMGRAVRETC